MKKRTLKNRSTNVSYRGDVKVSTYIGKHCLSTKTYRNTGALPLFRFLANCLAGNFPAAYQSRPYKVKLLKVTAEDANNVQLPEDLRKTTGVDRECSDFIPMTTAPEIIIQETDKGQSCKVMFSFMFPYSRIRYSGANMIAIYGPGVTDPTEYSAFYLLRRVGYTADNEETLEWDPIILDFEDDETNKIFAIEWTMTLSNMK